MNDNEYPFHEPEWMKTFGPHEARLFLQKIGLEPDCKDPVTGPLCAAVMHAAIHISTLHQELKETRDTCDKLRADLAKTEKGLDEAIKTITAITKTASTDALTGLPNRRDFESVLKQMIARRSRHSSAFPKASIIFIDLNDFKRVNSEHTHHGGDAALMHVASVIRSNLREGDYLSRIGGDEFAAIIYDVSNSEADQVARCLMKAVLDKPLNLDGDTIPLSISCGVRRIRKHDTPESLVKASSSDMLDGKLKSKLFAQEYILAKKQHRKLPDFPF